MTEATFQTCLNDLMNLRQNLENSGLSSLADKTDDLIGAIYSIKREALYQIALKKSNLELFEVRSGN